MTLSNKSKKQILRIKSFLGIIEHQLNKNEEIARIQNLINIDFCNESIIRIIASELETPVENSIYKVWEEINKFLIKSSLFTFNELPQRSEILDLIHKKRNFIQHAGECPNVDDIVDYFQITYRFIEKILIEFFGVKLVEFNKIDLIQNEEYRKLLSYAVQLNNDGELIWSIGILRYTYNFSTKFILGDGQKTHMSYSSLFNSEIAKFETNKNARYSSNNNFQTIFNDIEKKLNRLTGALSSIVSGELKIPDKQFSELNPQIVKIMIDNSINAICTSQTKMGNVDFEYGLDYCVKLILKLEAFNLLPPYDYSIQKPIIHDLEKKKTATE
jgi:hypothetical protein